MHQNIKELYGYTLAASDGEIGRIKDFYFDDRRWAVRYLVVDTGSWLPGRLVLLSPHAFGPLDQERKQLHVMLTRAQIEQAPSVDTHRPVSHQDEEAYYTYYGWPTYWTGDLLWGAAGVPLGGMPPIGATLHHGHNQRNDVHLRSMKAVQGYDLQATDGSCGSVSGFVVDDRTWAIVDLEVETGHWYAGKEIRLAPAAIDRVSYEESKVFVKLSQADLRQTAEHAVAKAGP